MNYNRNIVAAGCEDDDSDLEEQVEVFSWNQKKCGTQQTCLMSANSNQESSSRKEDRRKEYWRSKKKEQKLGVVPRPQDLPANHDFFVDAVKRNLGLEHNYAGEVTKEVKDDVLSLLSRVAEMNKTCSRHPVWIDTKETLRDFFRNIESTTEITVDLEYNNDQSFMGTTALLQISTTSVDALVDPFPVFLELKEKLQTVMASNKTLKIFCGVANDFLNLKRDFRVVSALTLDIQLLDSNLRNVPPGSNVKGLKELCKDYLNVNITKGETNRDFRRRPLPPDLIRYAQHDTYYVMAVFQEMKKQIFAKNNGRVIIKAIEDTSSLFKKLNAKERFGPTSLLHTLPNDIESILRSWRVEIGKLLDDKPENILSDAIIRFLSKQIPSNARELEKALGSGFVALKGNERGLLRILTERQAFFSSTACHKCGVLGHSAVQCNQPTNRQLEKEHQKLHPEKKAAQNRRRNLNKKRNKKLRQQLQPLVVPNNLSAVGTNGPSGSSTGNLHVTVSVNEGGITSPPQISQLPTSGGKGLPPRNPPRNQAYRDRGCDRDRPGGDRDGYQNRRERFISRSSTTLNAETESSDGDRRRPVNTYPDDNQLFVGNLPHFVTQQDMKDIFSDFGEVAEVRIQKPMPKSTGVNVPYFCFVVFEDASSAQLAIEKKGEIFMKLNGGSQRRLNVEPKRPQRPGRAGGDDLDAPYNRMESASPAVNRPSDRMRSQSRTFRGSNSGGGDGGGGMSGDRERSGNSSRGGISERGNIGRGGREDGGRAN